MSYKIIVEPRRYVFGIKCFQTPEEEKKCCKEIVEQIKRHVDEVGNIVIEEYEE